MFLAVVLCLLASVVGCSAEGSPGPTTDEVDDDSTPVAGFEVEPRDLTKTVRSSATVEPVERIRVKAHAGGGLTRLEVEEGDRVSGGQLLAETELAEKRAELARARAEADKFRREYERKQPLVEREAIGEAEVEELGSDLEIAEREVELWETRIELARVEAPKDAVVAERHVDPGGYVSADAPIVDLVDISTLVLPVTMSERDVVHLDEEESVSVTVDAYPERPVEGSIRRIFPTADVDSRRVPVEIAVDEFPEEMAVRPGFMARVAVDVDRRPDALAIPGESLLASTPDDRFVYVVDDDELVRRSVTTGVERRNLTEITEGLEFGEIIVGNNPTNLEEGTRAHVSEWVEVE